MSAYCQAAAAFLHKFFFESNLATPNTQVPNVRVRFAVV